MTTHNNQDERTLFEAEVRRRYNLHGEPFTRSPDGYCNASSHRALPMTYASLQMLWEIWQARAALASQQAVPQKAVPTILPDGSAFAVMSFPLPKDHWLYAPREYMPGADEPVELPWPCLERTPENEERARLAIRYAIRGSTDCGKESDFDPDALVQNALYALLGPYPHRLAATQEPKP